jgi:hypothetical protein
VALGIGVLALVPWLLLGVVGLWSEFSSDSPYKNDRVTCVVVNDGPVVLADVTVTVYELEYGAKMLAPGARFSFQFDPGPEGDYKVVVTAADGHQTRAHEGYFSSGSNGTDTLLVSPGQIIMAPAT